MNRSHAKTAVAILVLAVTVLAFIVYFGKNPQILNQLRQVHPAVLALLMSLYGLFLATLVYIQRATVRLCDIELTKREGSLLVMYSTIINFFGPLQSGPAFRAAYLKKQRGINLKKYAAATFMYYGFYALFSGVILLSFIIGQWSIAACLVLAGVVPLALQKLRFHDVSVRSISLLASASLAQVLVLSAIYYVELKSLQADVLYSQALSYTGAANFALFVSLTPGAIGFRESFLLFSQQIHGIGGETIALASIIDRSVYILFLLALALFVFGSHADEYLKKGRANRKI